MAFIEPAVLSDRNVRLEPLSLDHEAGLAAAAADGELWKLRVTSVPSPSETRDYIETALRLREQESRFAFAVIEASSATVLGSTNYHDILPAVKRPRSIGPFSMSFGAMGADPAARSVSTLDPGTREPAFPQ